MKKLFCLFALLTFILSSCKKDNKIAINNLIGEWSVVNDDPNLAVDGSISYTFNSDKTCIKKTSDFLSNKETSIHLTYIISVDNTLVTLYNDKNIYTEQYTITKLTGNEMKWENASPGDGNTNKRLVK